MEECDDVDEASDGGDDVASSSGFESASDVAQKRHRKGKRKSPKTKPRKTARIASSKSPRGGTDDDDGAFLEGFSRRWASWEDFNKAFETFQAAMFQQLSGRSSTSVLSRNKQMRDAVAREVAATGKSSEDVERRRGTRYIPADWKKYCRTLRCTHGQGQPSRSSGKRKHRQIRSTECTAKVNVRVVSAYSGWNIAVKASGRHNHPVTKHQWFNYAENRSVTDEGLIHDAAAMHKAGAHAKGILSYLREQSGGKLVTLRDAHNMIQKFKSGQRAGQTDAERALAVLDEFALEAEGNAAEIMVDAESKIARVVTFQSARMRRLFRAFPEAVLVDATHNTNANRYKLFSFVVHDVFGKGQYVFHSLVESEEKVNLGLVIKSFKKLNPAWSKIRVIMTDKAMHEKAVLLEAFPDACQLLCQWHVITWLRKQATRLAPECKSKVQGLVKALVYSRCPQEYEDTKDSLLKALGGDDEHPIYAYFIKNWDSTKDEWVSYRRSNVEHLQNNTNNRLES
ncbi:hypothetical protein F443_18230, partial [Phytophthora nicotianae P1569]